MDRLPCGICSETYRHDIAIVQTKARWVWAIGSLIFLFALPLFTGERTLGIVNHLAITLIAVLGLSILTGGCGQISLGHAAFMAVGAYFSSYIVGNMEWPFFTGLLCGGLSAGLIGLIFGMPSLRVKGFYLILVTIAAQFILVGFLPYQLVDYTGGANGLDAPPPEIFGLILDSEYSIFFLNIGIAILMTFFAKNLLRTRVGRAFIAIRDNDLAASVMGINLFGYKLLAFFIGCFYAGIAGSLFAHYTGHVDPGFFTVEDSIWYIGMIIVGGIGSIAGAVMGTIFLTLLTESTLELSPLIGDAIPALSGGILASLSLVVPGLVIILFLIFEPRGLYHRWLIVKTYFQFWPYSY